MINKWYFKEARAKNKKTNHDQGEKSSAWNNLPFIEFAIRYMIPVAATLSARAIDIIPLVGNILYVSSSPKKQETRPSVNTRGERCHMLQMLGSSPKENFM